MEYQAPPPPADEISLPALPDLGPLPLNSKGDRRGMYTLGRERAHRPKGAEGARTQITHDVLIDWLLANPTTTNKEMAADLGLTPNAVSVILNSDAFQARYQARKREMLDPVLCARLEDRIKGLASRSVEILMESLNDEKAPSPKLALEIFKETSRAAGYGAEKPVAVQNNFVVALPGPAASSREWHERFAPAGATVVMPRVDDAPAE